jgi:serine protease Do
VDDKPIPHITALQFALGPKYAGDVISLKISRDGKEKAFEKVTLGANLSTYIQPFLGILPMRDDPEPGVEVRYVFPGSPADKAGIKPGDRLMQLTPPTVPTPGRPPVTFPPLTGRDDLAGRMLICQPNTDVQIQLKKKDGGKNQTVTVKLSIVTDELPEAAPLPSSKEKALEKPKGASTATADGKVIGKKPEEKKPEEKKPEEKKDDKKPEKKAEDDEEKKEPEFGLIDRTNTTLGRQYWVYVPKNYNKNVSHGVILWLHDAGNGGKDSKDVSKTWADYCEANHMIIVGPRSQSNTGWVASETEGVIGDLKEVLGQYTIDKRRVIAHGIGSGGQMAYYLGFNARQYIRGVAVSSAALGTQPKENVPGEYLSFFIVGGDKDPAIKEIRDSRPQLVEKRFPVLYRELKDFGKQYLDEKSFFELHRWIDSLDRI